MYFWKIAPQEEIMIKSKKSLVEFEEKIFNPPRDVYIKCKSGYIKGKQVTELKEKKCEENS